MTSSPVLSPALRIILLLAGEVQVCCRCTHAGYFQTSRQDMGS